MNIKKIVVLKDNMCFSEKPLGKEVAGIRDRLKNSKPEEITIDELFETIKRGNTILPGVSKNGTKKEDFMQQDIVMIDIDNKDVNSVLSPEEAIKICEDNGLALMGLYHTFSSTKDCPRYRLVFRLDKTVYDRFKMEFILKVLISLFPNADKQCKDTSRLYYGTNGNQQEVIIINKDAVISFEDVDRISQKIELENTPYLKENYKYGNYIEQLKSEFPLLEYMKEDNHVERVSGNIVYFKDCHINGTHEGCLRYYSDTNTFNCFGEHCGKGGSIIDYVKETKKLSYPAALDYVKNELAPKYNVVLDIKETVSKEKMANYFDIIIKQLKDFGLEYAIPDKFDWLIIIDDKKNNLTSCKVDTAKLAMYIKNHLNYLLAKSEGQDSILIYLYENGRYKCIIEEQFKSVIKCFIPEMFHSSRVNNEVFNLLMTDNKYITTDELNNNENIINYKNGIYNVITDEFTPHSPEIYSTIQLAYDYKEKVEPPTTRYFDNFMKDLSNNDEEVEKCLIQYMGVAHSNIKGYRAKTGLMMVGPGNTGKTVAKTLMTSLIGKENCTGIDLNGLEDKYGRAELFNKRIAGSNDMAFVKLQSLDVYKQATGGDYISGSIKYGPAINFVYNGVIWLCGNTLPKFSGDRGSWVYDRILVIECKNVIPKEKRDKKLLEHLLSEGEYILYRLRKGVKEFIANGYEYNIPKSSLVLKDTYKKENNSVLTFRDECMKPRDNKKIQDKFYTCYKVYQIYVNWYKANYHDNFFENNREFKNFMGGKEAIKKTHNGNEYYQDWELTENAINRYYQLNAEIDEEIPKTEILETENQQQTLKLEETVDNISKLDEFLGEELPF